MTTHADDAIEIPSPTVPKSIAGYFLGHLADLKPWKDGDVGLRMITYKENWYKSIGPDAKTMKVNLAGSTLVFTADLNVVQKMFSEYSNSFTAGKNFVNSWLTMLPQSIICLKGDDWKRVRSVYVKAIQRLDFDEFPPMLNQICENAFKKYLNSDAKEHDILLRDLFSKVTFDSFHMYAFKHNYDVLGGKNKQVLKDCVLISDTISQRALMSPNSVKWSKLFLFKEHRLQAALTRLRSYLDKFISERQSVYKEMVKSGEFTSQTKAKSLLDALIFTALENEDDPKLTREELRDQIATGMFGSFDTTTFSLSLFLMQLSKNPEVQQKLADEVKDVDLSTATYEEIERYTYLNNVIKEANRLCPVVQFFGRRAKENVVVQGYKIPKDTEILIDHYQMARTPEYWNNQQDLTEFRPERWDEHNPPNGSYNPFGFGVRCCVGKRNAELNLKVIIAYIMQKFKVASADKPATLRSTLGVGVTDDSKLRFIARKK